MLNSSKSFENHPNSNITFAYDLQEPPHHPETSDLSLKNIEFLFSREKSTLIWL